MLSSQIIVFFLNSIFQLILKFKFYTKHVAPHVKIKAAGGISSIADAEKFIALGADRLGTSRIVKIAKGLADDGTY